MNAPVDVLQEKRKRLVSGLPRIGAAEFVRRYAEVLDEYFMESFARSKVGPRLKMEKNPCALFALGGYGRKEQCLHSDVDVLVLFERHVPQESRDLVRELFYPLWDVGLEVGYGIRSLRECTRLAARDHHVLASLLDARFLCGISSLYAALMEQIEGELLKRKGTAFLGWLLKASEARHARFGDSSYLLEPNVKEGLGGLRDYHAIRWIARARYGLRGVDELVDQGHLGRDERNGLFEALSFLWAVRNGLHRITGRKYDQLCFEYQVELAQELGYRDGRGQRAVERFLGAMHAHMEFVKHLHLRFMARLTRPRARGKGRGFGTLRPGLGLRRIHGELHFDRPVFREDGPLRLIRIFEQSALSGIPVSPEALREVRSHVGLVDRAFRMSSAAARSFRRILLAPAWEIDPLNEMLSAGMLTALIPEMKAVQNRIQYDAYHVHPVDKHCLLTVRALKALGKPASGSKASLYQRLYREVGSREALLWAALLHDVGKGSPGRDHCEQGARIARRVVARMGLGDSEVEKVCFLVREHLALIRTATERDLQDEKVVVRFARRFRDVEALKMLCLLTMADSVSTGPQAWNAWRDVLVRELFFKAYHMLEKGELATRSTSEVVEGKRKELLRMARRAPDGGIEELLEHMSPRYLLDTPTKDILRHVDLVRGLRKAPFVLDPRPGPAQDLRIVTICAEDRPGLFAAFSGVFALNRLDILNANIYTWGNRIALDRFTVKFPQVGPPEDELWSKLRDDLQCVLAGELALDRVLERKALRRSSPRRPRPAKAGRVVVDNRGSDFFTIIEVTTYDSPGLLYRITSSLFRCGLDVRIAKIATKADQVVDVFYVRDLEGQKVAEEAQILRIRDSLLHVLPGKTTNL